jgi:hypothetical protein
MTRLVRFEVEVEVIDDDLIPLIVDRIKDQLSGHRTPMRLSDHVEIRVVDPSPLEASR